MFTLNSVYLKNKITAMANEITTVKYKSNAGTVTSVSASASVYGNSGIQVMVSIPWTNIGVSGYVSEIEVYTSDNVLVGKQTGMKLMSPNNEAVVFMIMIEALQFSKNSSGNGTYDKVED